jgi:SAM-dependent methyltransferase
MYFKLANQLIQVVHEFYILKLNKLKNDFSFSIIFNPKCFKMADTDKRSERTIPGVYEQYLGPYIFEPYAVYTADRIKNAPELLLEIASGTGRVTRHIAERIGVNAKLLATDLNPAMLEIARLRVGNPNVEFRKANAMELPFPDNHFDCVICQFGFMFLPDRQKGFNEVWRVLKPGGQFLFSTWDRPENNITYPISHQTVVRFLKSPPPPFYGRPYSMSDPVELQNHTRAAGFENVAVEKVTLSGESPSAMDVAIGFVEGNAIIHEILKEGPELLETIKAAIEIKIHEQVSTDPVRSELNAWIGEAFK